MTNNKINTGLIPQIGNRTQNVQETSKMAYIKLTKSQLQKRTKDAYDYLKKIGRPASRRVIANAIGIEPSSMSAVAQRLIVSWDCAMNMDKKELCPITGNKVMYLGLKKDLKFIQKSTDDK